MGNGNDKSNEVVIRQVDERNDNTNGQRGSNTSGSSTTSTTERGTRGTDDRGSGAARGRSTKAEQKEVVSGLPILKDETPEEKKKREERNAKRRERYAKQKAEQGQTVKPKKVNTKKKKQDDAAIDTNQLNIIIKTISTLIASRPNCSHWLLSDAEIESITTPLTKMMQESDIFNKLGEHSNQIALVTACVTVFVPRIIQTTIIVKENKKRVREVKQSANQGKVISIDRQDDKRDRNANDGKVDGTNEHWTSTLIY